MRKEILIAILAMFAVLALGINAQASVEDVSKFVTATGTVGSVTTMDLDQSSIDFGTATGDTFPVTPANKKIVITYSSNHDPWRIAIHTYNTNVKNFADGGRYAKGGLATADGEHVVACKWVCQDNATAVPNIADINVGGEEDTGYNFVKDTRDENDPATPDNESWASAFADAYADIAYGAPGNASPYSWCVDPTVYYAVNDPRNYKGDPADGSIAVYVACLFGTNGMTPPVPAAAGSYSAKIYFMLYHE